MILISKTTRLVKKEIIDNNQSHQEAELETLDKTSHVISVKEYE